jgi:predicted nucleic acid-binding protein
VIVQATFDSSFWVHACSLEIIDFLLHDYRLLCTPAVEKEFRQVNPTSLRLGALLSTGQIRRAATPPVKVKLYGEGERAAINLALEMQIVLLIDDWKPYQAAKGAGVETINSPVYLLSLYERGDVSFERLLEALAKLSRRGTIKPGWIVSALRMAALLRSRSPKKGERRDEKD